MRHLLIYLLIPASVAFAASETDPDSLTLEQAIVNVLEHNPSLKAAGFDSKAAAARIRTAQLKPALHTSIEFENFGGSGIFDGTDLLESTLSLSKVLELGDKARLRGDVARDKAMVLRNEQDAERLDLLAETANRFIEVITRQERHVIAKEFLTLAQDTHDVVAMRVKAGKSANAELRRAKISLERIKLKHKQSGYSLETARFKLASLWGETEAHFSIARGDILQTNEPTAFETLVQLLDNNPDLIRLATEKRLAETRIQLERSGRRADIKLAGGLRHFNATDDVGLVVSLDIPFGSRSRAAPKIEEAEFYNQRSPLDLEQRRLELHTTLFEVHQEMSQAVDAVTSLRDTIIPLAERALNDYEKGYAAGRYSLLELNVAQKTLLDSRLELVEAATDYHRYRIEIDRLTG
ncbi:MAG: TolC family protein, partial [Thiotrichales bacterium]